jgi:zinc protease
MTGPDFVRLRFANGVLLNYHRNTYDGKAVSVRVRFGDGRHEIQSDQLMLAELGAQMLKLGGLGRNSYDEVADRLRVQGWDLKMAVGDETFLVAGDTTTSGLDDELNLLAAYLSDPGFRSASLDGLLATSVDALYRSYDSMPALVMAKTMAETLTPGAPNNFPARETMMAWKAADLSRVLRPILTQAPLEVTIVGDVDEKDAIAAVAASLGALPARPAASRPKPDAWFMRFPADPPRVTRVEHHGNKETAMLGVYWPLYVATPARRREEYALYLLSGVMRDELRHRVREDLGMTYTPSATTQMPDNADQGYMIAAVETRPGDVETVRKEVEALAARLAKGEITQGELDAVRQPILADDAARQVTNDWWVNLLSASTRDGQGMRDLLERRQKFEAITLDEVKAAAAAWLAHPPIVIIAAPAAQDASK